MNTKIMNLVKDDRITPTYEICFNEAFIPYCEYRNAKDFNTKLQHYGRMTDFAYIVVALIDKYYPFENITTDEFNKFFVNKLQNKYEDA